MKKTAAVGAGFLFALGAQAQTEAPVDLPAMQVTAGRAGEALYAIPQPVSIVGQEEIARSSPQVITDALRGQTGAFVQSSGPGQGLVIVRGLKGSEILHLVDGMRFNNAFFRNSPSQYIGLLDPQGIERIELLRGPYASIYGSDAMGGVVQFLTPEPRFYDAAWSWRGGLAVGYDSADLARTARSYAAAGTSRFSFSGGFSFSEFGQRKLAELAQSPDGRGGFVLAERVGDTDYLSRAFDGKALWNPDGAHELMLAAQYFEIPELERYFQTVPGFSGTVPARAIARLMNDRAFYHARYRYALPLGFAEKLELHLGQQIVNDDRLDRRQDNSRDEFTFNRSVLTGFTAQAETGFEAHRLRYGLELYTDRVDSAAYREAPPGSGTITLPDGATFFSPFPDGSRADDYGVWLLDEWLFGPEWLLDAGARYGYHVTDIAQGDRAFGARLTDRDFTGNVGLRYAVTPALALTANVGRGFRAPNLFDLAVVGQRANNRVVVANLDLKPESVTTFDTGLKFQAAGAAAELVLFYSDYSDRIVTVNPAFAEGTPDCPDDGDAATLGCAQNQNIAESRYYGLESGLSYQPVRALTLRAVLNYTWGDQEENGVKDAANRVPPLNGRMVLEYRPLPILSVEPAVYFAGRQDRLDANDRSDSRIDPNGTPGWASVHVRTTWTPSPDRTLRLSVDNLLDQSYREHGSGIDAPGRGVTLGFEQRFG